MSRDVPFYEDDICDECGKKGAYDFMGDCFCSECLSKERDMEQQEKKETTLEDVCAYELGKRTGQSEILEKVRAFINDTASLELPINGKRHLMEFLDQLEKGEG